MVAIVPELVPMLTEQNRPDRTRAALGLENGSENADAVPPNRSIIPTPTYGSGPHDFSGAMHPWEHPRCPSAGPPGAVVEPAVEVAASLPAPPMLRRPRVAPCHYPGAPGSTPTVAISTFLVWLLKARSQPTPSSSWPLSLKVKSGNCPSRRKRRIRTADATIRRRRRQARLEPLCPGRSPWHPGRNTPSV